MNILKQFVMAGLVLVMGCGAARSYNYSEGINPNNSIITLLIVNDGFYDTKIYDDIGRRLATVTSMRAKCIRIMNPERTPGLTFSFIGQPTRWPTMFQNFDSSSGWIWRINSHTPTHSANAMMPANQCEVGRTYSSVNIR